jgi:hypothetical protein
MRTSVLIHCCRCASSGHTTSCAAMYFSAAFSKVIVLTCVTAAVDFCASLCSIGPLFALFARIFGLLTGLREAHIGEAAEPHPSFAAKL